MGIMLPQSMPPVAKMKKVESVTELEDTSAFFHCTKNKVL